MITKKIEKYKIKKNPYKHIRLSSIISQSDYELFNNKLIISQIYPDNPFVILNDKNDPMNEPPGKSNPIY